MDETMLLNFSIEFSRKLYTPTSEFQFKKIIEEGEQGYVFPPVVTVSLAYDPLTAHDGSYSSNYNITPVVSLITKTVNGILYYTGFKVHWMGENVPESLENTYISAIAIIRR